MGTPAVETSQALLILGVIWLVNALLHYLPSMIFSGKRETPRILVVLGKYLPHAVVGMLIVYCMRGTEPLAYPYGIPEIIACALTAILHFWKRNSLLSIGCGVGVYMVLLQVVF